MKTKHKFITSTYRSVSARFFRKITTLTGNLTGKPFEIRKYKIYKAKLSHFKHPNHELFYITILGLEKDAEEKNENFIRYKTLDLLYKDWDIIDRRVLIEKTGVYF